MAKALIKKVLSDYKKADGKNDTKLVKKILKKDLPKKKK